MAFILSTEALLRLLSARSDDPVVAWLEGNRIRPFIAATTMALARYAILGADAVGSRERGVFLRRLERVDHDLRTGRSEQVSLAVFDLKAAEILSDLLAVEPGREDLSDLDLVPAAIAVQHNLELVATEEVESWASFSAAIPPEIGRLSLRRPDGSRD